MGRAMCGHLLDAGYGVTLTTRTRAKAAPLEAQGARWVDTAAEVAAASDVVFTMLGYPDDVRDVVMGPRGILKATIPGTVLVDMSTSEPALAIEIGAECARRGGHSLDAPVSGGDVGAQNATLSIMVGGDAAVFDAVRPCFDVLGSNVLHLGTHSAG